PVSLLFMNALLPSGFEEEGTSNAICTPTQAWARDFAGRSILSLDLARSRADRDPGCDDLLGTPQGPPLNDKLPIVEQRSELRSPNHRGRIPATQDESSLIET